MAIKVHSRPVYKFSFSSSTGEVTRFVKLVIENPANSNLFLFGDGSVYKSLEELGIGSEYFFNEKEALHNLLYKLKNGLESCEEYRRLLEQE